MRENTLKQRLEAGRAAFGVMCTFPSPHPEVQKMMERGVETIVGAGRVAGCSCPDTLVPKFLGLGVRYFHSTVGRLLQQSSETYLNTMRQAEAGAGK